MYYCRRTVLRLLDCKPQLRLVIHVRRYEFENVYLNLDFVVTAILYATNAPTEAYTTLDAQQNTNARVPLGVILPSNAEISPDVCIRRIAEELTNSCGIQNRGASFVSHPQNTHSNGVLSESANTNTDDDDDDNLDSLLEQD
jgi:hypothetical protein